jgi:pimeloyl-ACP methyl ester carboxylesterase
MPAFVAPLPLRLGSRRESVTRRALATLPTFRATCCTLQSPPASSPPPLPAPATGPAAAEEVPVASIAVLSAKFVPPPQPARAEPPVVVVIPGYGSPSSDYAGLCSELEAVLGSDAVVRVAKVTVGTWARTLGGRPVTPVLERIDAAVDAAVREGGGGRNVTLVGHSAGGWIGRIYLSRSAEYDGRVWRGADKAGRLICLGTPQRSGEAVTRRNMMFVNEECAGCAEDGVDYVCIGGTGACFEEGDGGGGWRFWERGWLSRVSYGITDADGGALRGDGR